MNDCSSLHYILYLINRERASQSEYDLLSRQDEDFSCHEFWSNLFARMFLENSTECSASGFGDDLLFFVDRNKQSGKKPKLTVLRRNSPKLPDLGDTHINWEETVYLNLLMQYFVYVITVAVYTRTGPREWQILKKVSEKVYASPSYRHMHNKGYKEVLVYPDLYFNVDNFEEVFSECVIRDSECLSVELTAYDRSGHLHGVCFLGSVSYNTIKHFYEADPKTRSIFRGGCRSNKQSNSAFPGSSPVHSTGKQTRFMRVMGPHAIGLAEFAISPLPRTVEPGAISKQLNSSNLMSRCCQLSRSDTYENQSDGNAQCPDSSVFLSSVITQQPSNELINFIPVHDFDKNSMIDTYDNNKQVASTGLNSMPALYPSSVYAKSAGASLESSPIRRQRLFNFNRSSQSVLPPSNCRQFSRISQLLFNPTELVENRADDLGPSDGQPDQTFRRLTTNNFTEGHNPEVKSNELAMHEDLDVDHSLLATPGARSGNKSFGQSWYWFKERRKLVSVGLNASLTFISLPCHNVLIELLESRREPILTFSNYQ